MRLWTALGTEQASVTACQEFACVRICPHCVTPVQPTARIQLPDLRVGLLAPIVYTLAPRSVACSFWHYDCSRLEHGPRLSGGLGLIGRTAPDQLGDWPVDSRPHEAASSSGRLAHKTQSTPAVAPHGLCRVPLLASSRPRNLAASPASTAMPSETITAPLAGRPLRRCSAIMVLPRLHKLLRDANLPELHLFNSRRTLSVRILRIFRSKER